ncbi:hypothetical protein B0A49_01807 [Cryomyces minteri]|uniref:DUF7492 domain-containing protein n=1 Tax=Cryomyces minteri TaxID=331657 RepID=A0A4U0XJM5_9PEZI|nr:hypothetical protein B0A49_01807 [Cryomyces minteri]
MRSPISTTALYALAIFLVNKAAGHSWNEQLQVIKNGTFVGDYGYPRGYVARTDPGFTGDSMNYLLPSLKSGRTRIDNTDLLCHPAQRSTTTQPSAYPRLQVAPGSFVAMKYLENGHVTLPATQLGKPQAGGPIFVFGTTSPSATEKLTDVLQWTADGSGGDKRGRLLAAQNYDDLRCHQINSGTISQQRQQQFPDRPADRTMGTGNEQWCETDVQMPMDAKAGAPLTLYWVWQWPTAAGKDAGLPDGKDEFYTTCSDVDVVAGPIKIGKPVHTIVQQDPQTAAVKEYQSRTAFTSTPGYTASGSGSGSGSASSASASASASHPHPHRPPPSSSSTSPASQTTFATLTATTTTTPTITSTLPSAIPSDFLSFFPQEQQATVTEIDDVTVVVTDVVTVTATPSAAAAGLGRRGLGHAHDGYRPLRHGAKVRW